MRGLASATLLLLSTIAGEAKAQPTGGTAGRDLTVEITQAGAATIPTRTNVAFIVTVSNIRSGQANNVLVSVTIPSAFTALSGGSECSFKGTSGTCTTASLGGNSQKAFRITGTAPSTITGASQSFTLTAVADPNNTVDEGTGGNNNNSDNFTVNVVTRADLNVGIGGSGQAATVQAAPDLVFVVTVDNDGDQAASNLLVRTTLPEDTAFVRVEENQLGNCAQNSTASNGALNINCTLSSLPAGASRHVRIVGRLVGSVPDGVQVTSAVNVDPNNTVPERNENDNTAFLVSTMRAPSDLQLTGGVTSHSTRARGPTESGATCRAGYAIRLDLTVKNNGPNPSGATRIATQWPVGIVSSESSTCFDSCNVPVVNPGQSVTIVMGGLVNANLATGTRITSTVDPSGTLLDAVVANNRVQFTCV